MTATSAWPFGTDADRDDPLTKLRIPVVGSFNPQWKYVAAYLNTLTDGPDYMRTPPFASNERPTEMHTTILQALMLMNGDFIGTQTDLQRSEVLAAIVDMPGWDTKQRVTALFMTVLSRNPTPEELEKFGSYIDRGGPTGDKKKATADVFWVLLNSPEFLFNH